MAFIYPARHTAFMQTLEASIKTFEHEGYEIVTNELKRSLAELKNIYTECDTLTNQLRTLIQQYQLLQHRTRTQLRFCRQKNDTQVAILKNHSSDTLSK
ncbi:hypothetical protein [Niabella sp.]|uniref:hypothetical protein n=1 Tax=Niabella sp. TaxID=1962976 RepID=UPI0026162002|nr:hypothetical protein [Niabella sp.]